MVRQSRKNLRLGLAPSIDVFKPPQIILLYGEVSFHSVLQTVFSPRVNHLQFPTLTEKTAHTTSLLQPEPEAMHTLFAAKPCTPPPGGYALGKDSVSTNLFRAQRKSAQMHKGTAASFLGITQQRSCFSLQKRVKTHCCKKIALSLSCMTSCIKAKAGAVASTRILLDFCR